MPSRLHACVAALAGFDISSPLFPQWAAGPAKRGRYLLRDALVRICTEFSAARGEEFKQHKLADFIRQDAAESVRSALGARKALLSVDSSPGAGRWADIPWITVMDPRVTTSPTRGYYIAYLFNWRRLKISLSLNQGSTQLREDYGSAHASMLAERAGRMRTRVTNFVPPFSSTPIELDAETPLGRSYEPGHSIGVTYDVGRMPSQAALEGDLHSMIAAYGQLFLAGGIDPPGSDDDHDGIEAERPQATTLIEKRIYRAHRSIERRSANASLVKSFHGCTCQACGVTFEVTYGPIGAGYIEAHHLTPLATLAEGIPVKMSVAADFCVLCANCHRMIHRQDDPSDLAELRKRILVAATTR